jgi:glycosyltransferase involved in cell wall biosynthesis
MAEKFPLSVVMLTSNKQDLVGKCLDSVKWADDIVILDDCSIDKTVEVARQYTDRIFIRKLELEGRDRNWAYAQAKNRWVLSLDDDEVVTPELEAEIKRVLSANPQENGFTIPRKNYIGDYWVKYGGWYPAAQLKLFKKDKFKFEEVEIHGRAFMDEPCGHLKADIIHYTYRDFDEFLRKLNRQTTLEAQKWFRQNKPMRLGRFIYRAVDRFIRTYIGRKGYKDGFIGFTIAFFASLYQVISYLKYRELVLKNKQTNI